MRLIDADALIEKMKDCGFSTAQELMANAFCFAALKSESLAPTIGGWINVKDRLPEIHQHVITFDTVHGMRVDWLSKEREWAWGYHTTHWMPLPEPPKEGE